KRLNGAWPPLCCNPYPAAPTVPISVDAPIPTRHHSSRRCVHARMYAASSPKRLKMTFEKKTEPIFKRLTQALLPYSRSLGLAILFLGLISCESEFEAFEPGPTSFGVYGYLDTAADTQFVRVIAIRRTLERDGQGFEGTVTITNLDTGEAYVAQDS